MLIGGAFVILGLLSANQAVSALRDEAEAPRIIALQEEQVRKGLRDPSDVWSRSSRDSPYIGPVGLNSPASLMGQGFLLLVAGTGIILRQRWAMLLGLPLLLLILVRSKAGPGLVEQIRQGDQPGSFASIGIPLYGLMIVLPVVAAIVLLRAAVRPSQSGGARAADPVRIHR